MFLIDFQDKSRISSEITAHLCKVTKIIATFAKNRNEMKVERETAGFALPFTAGVLFAAYSGYGIDNIHTFSLIASPALFATIMLMHTGRRHLSPKALWLIIGTAALSAGMICGFTSSLISPGHTEPAFWHRAEESGQLIRDAIDSIPFGNRNCNAVAKALVTGERKDIPTEIIEVFRDSGASHILALSGLHLGIIYGIIVRLLSALGNRRSILTARSVLIISVCGFYTIVTGAGPSIVRAFLFILLAETGRMTHRHHSTGQLVCTALILQLTLSPLSAKSVGFQLSYAAMAGIAFILPGLKSFWKGNIYDDHPFTGCIRRIWNACAMSISCQITTAPLAYLYFGTFPKHFLLTNLMALPLTGLVIPAILTTVALESLGICPYVAVRLTEALISTLIDILDVISEM